MYSIAQRISWASERDTKRPEDKAYCLMGLFDINMPLLYGEGQKAFVRLQEKIIGQTDDHSIFAWSKDGTMLSGLLAPDPAYFKNCGTVVLSQFLNTAEPFQMTNRGLSVKLNVTPWTADTYLSWLDCEKIGSGRLGIFLRRLVADDHYVRVEVNGKSVEHDRHRRSYDDDRLHNYISLRVPQAVNLQLDGNYLMPRSYGFQFVEVEHFERDFCEEARFWVYKGQWCDEQRLACIPQGLCGTAVIVHHTTAHWSGIRSVTLGFDFEFNPVCFVDDSSHTDGWLETPDVCSYSGISDRCLQDHDWYTIHEGSRVYRRKDHNNVWAVKGHRIHGLDVMLMESPTTSRSKDLRISITRAVISERLVWTCSLATSKIHVESSSVDKGAPAVS
jgi:hypothetical protein